MQRLTRQANILTIKDFLTKVNHCGKLILIEYLAKSAKADDAKQRG